MNDNTSGPNWVHMPAQAKVELSYLIEDWQNLIRAIQNNDWEAVQVTTDCLAELIRSSSHDNPDLKFQPSAVSLIHMGNQAGVLTRPDGTDFDCAIGMPVHDVMYGETCQCTEQCRQEHGCEPEKCQVLLQGGFMYDGSGMKADELLRFLETAKN